MAVTVNYTPEQTVELVADYRAGVAVETIANKLGKSVRSVIAKLSREGVYQAKARTTKTGDAIVKKDTVVDALQMRFKLTDAEADSLTKANKTALVKSIRADVAVMPVADPYNLLPDAD